MPGRWMYVIGIIGLLAVLALTFVMATAAQAGGAPAEGLFAWGALASV